VYHPQTEKMVVTRDVHFNEDQNWDWKNPQRTNGSFNNVEDNHLEKQTIELLQNELEDEPSIRGTRLLSDIYKRCKCSNMRTC